MLTKKQKAPAFFLNKQISIWQCELAEITYTLLILTENFLVLFLYCSYFIAINFTLNHNKKTFSYYLNICIYLEIYMEQLFC